MNLFNGTPWAVQVTVRVITVTAQATSSPDRHDTQGSGDFDLATNGDIRLARRAVSVVRHQRRAI